MLDVEPASFCRKRDCKNFDRQHVWPSQVQEDEETPGFWQRQFWHQSMCWRLHVSPPNNSLQRRHSSSTWNPFHFTHYVFQERVSEDFWIIRTGKNKTNLISLLKWNIWKVKMLRWWVICCSGTDEDTGGGARGRAAEDGRTTRQ